MRWPTAPLMKVAPPKPSSIRFAPDDVVWHLTLDQIGSSTGNIINKKMDLASKAGTSSYVFDDGNVLYSKLRPYLNKVICPSQPGIATTELIPLRPNPRVLNRQFLTYYLRSTHFLSFANVAVAGVKMPRVIMAELWKHELPLPPLSEQRRIVEILDQADALRKKRAEADAKAARILPALFYKMFGDPATNPKGWPIVELKKLGTPLSGGAFPLTEQGKTKAEVPFIKVSDMNSPGNEVYIRYANNYVSRDTLERLRVKAAPAGTTVFPKIGAAVATNKKRLLVQDTAYDNNVMGVVPKDPHHAHYIFAFFLLFDLRWLTRTTAVPSIKTSELARLPMLKPDDELIAEFDRQFRQLLAIRDDQAKSSKSIDWLFSVLLHLAFAGDLTARWREAHMQELLAEMEQQAKALEVSAAEESKPKARSRRHAGHDDRPLGRVKLAKLFYLVQRKAELELTQQFALRAAGPVDDAIHKFLSLARKQTRALSRPPDSSVQRRAASTRCLIT